MHSLIDEFDSMDRRFVPVPRSLEQNQALIEEFDRTDCFADLGLRSLEGTQ